MTSCAQHHPLADGVAHRPAGITRRADHAMVDWFARLPKGFHRQNRSPRWCRWPSSPPVRGSRAGRWMPKLWLDQPSLHEARAAEGEARILPATLVKRSPGPAAAERATLSGDDRDRRLHQVRRRLLLLRVHDVGVRRRGGGGQRVLC